MPDYLANRALAEQLSDYAIVLRFILDFKTHDNTPSAVEKAIIKAGDLTGNACYLMPGSVGLSSFRKASERKSSFEAPPP